LSLKNSDVVVDSRSGSRVAVGHQGSWHAAAFLQHISFGSVCGLGRSGESVAGFDCRRSSDSLKIHYRQARDRRELEGREGPRSMVRRGWALNLKAKPGHRRTLHWWRDPFCMSLHVPVCFQSVGLGLIVRSIVVARCGWFFLAFPPWHDVEPWGVSKKWYDVCRNCGDSRTQLAFNWHFPLNP